MNTGIKNIKPFFWILIFKIHFVLLAIVVVNVLVFMLSSFTLKYYLLFVIKIVIIVSGMVLFFKAKQFARFFKWYFSMYIITPILLLFSFLVGGIFVAFVAALLLKPLLPNYFIVKQNDIIVYSEFKGFLAPCCTYSFYKDYVVFEKKLKEEKLEDTDIIHAKVILQQSKTIKLITRDSVYLIQTK